MSVLIHEPVSVVAVFKNGRVMPAKFLWHDRDIYIVHHFIYPHSPKINGVAERFNRTIQDEFINRNDEIYYDPLAFEEKLLHCLNWYNTKRSHHSLNMQTPMAYLQQFI